MSYAPGIKEIIPRKRAEQLSQFLEPIAKDGGAQVFLTVGERSTVTVNTYQYSSQQASVAQNNIRRYLGPALPESGHFQNEVLYLRQASGDVSARAGDRGTIEKFSPRAVKLRFMNDDVKRAVVDQPANPFRMAFLVDGAVSTVEGKPALYKIYAVHDAFERPS